MPWPWNIPCLPQDFLRNGGTLEKMQQALAVKVSRHPFYPELVQLRYDQINSKLDDPVVQQCRGLILDESHNWDVVARPFDKFFNYGDPRAPKLNWTDVRVQEKLDGSLMIVYFYKGFWQVATIGSPNAGGEVNGCGFTFNELFWRVWYSKQFKWPEKHHEAMTLMFELTTPYNRVVVKQDGCNLKLVGLRSTWSGQEMATRHQPVYDPVKEFRLRTIEEIDLTFQIMDPLQQEGYVVVDEYFNRIKVKHPGYVAIHHMKEGFGPKRVLDVVRKAETAELVASFPEWKDAFEQVQAAYDGLVMVLEQKWAEVKDIQDRKAFAHEALLAPNPASLFLMRDGRAKSIRETLQFVQIDKLMGLLGLREMDINLVGSGT